MGLRERYRQLPPNPFRRERRDMLVGFGDAVISGMEAVAAATRRVTLPSETERTIALTLASNCPVTPEPSADQPLPFHLAI